MSIQVAISDQFLKAYNKLPSSDRHQVSKFIQKFKRDPMGTGLNYEVIQGAPDPKLRSLRVTNDYRAIVLKPRNGNLYALLWVDHHDAAYRWACNRRAEVHPETGSLQILTTTETVQQALPENDPTAHSTDHSRAQVPSLFDKFKEKDLLRLGVPEALLPVIHQLCFETDLEKALPYFPEEAAEALVGLAAGFSIEEIYSQQAESREAVDTDDLEKAFTNPDTLRRFVIIDDDQDLEALLDKPLDKWRVFLHPSQRRIIHTDLQGAIRVLGGAGTGKTVVAMHRAKWLAERLASVNDRILFTTFTKNLAVDIRSHLTQICTPEQLRHIEVINLDAWVQQFLNKQGYDFKLVYQAKTKAKACWENALDHRPESPDLSDAFYRDEWEQVISAQGLTSMRDYFKASRVGRGTPLDRSTRKKIWPVFQAYRLQLQEHGLRDVDDAYRDAREMLALNPGILPYRHVLVDETQDMGEQALKLTRQIVPLGPNDLFLVGDAHQRIYNRKVVLKNCGINIQGRNHSFRLKVNYRTTDEIRRWAVSLLKNCAIDDLDDKSDTSKGYHSLMFGEHPVIASYKDLTAETDAMVQKINELRVAGVPEAHICIVARTHEQVNHYANAMERNGLPIYTLSTGDQDSSNQPGIRLATMHRVKGLEFDFMFVAGANATALPLAAAMQGLNDATERERAETRERSLLYVAATRARKSLFISGYGHLSSFVQINS